MIDERRPLEVVRTGRLGYRSGLDLQAERVRARRAGEVPDTLYLVEHDPVLTLGTSTRSENLLLAEDELRARGYELAEVGRGGDVTYHGPGQLVGYPVLDLKPDRTDLHRYLRDLEEVLIRALAAFGLEAGREDGLTGVWLPEGKVAAIGVRVSSGWITSHGFALNVDPDLSRFGVIVPCGIADRAVTSMAQALGSAPDPARVEAAVVTAFSEVFDRRVVDQPPAGA
ncbi:lipoyl(octanoyl) transferase LipB [Gaopeijia maritima]|uniref:lipoyl(octanoyl) transferase LipB n=1 Tax=Gaopeijia maritima TaxID=3119007 RepID=UPI0032513F59